MCTVYDPRCKGFSFAQRFSYQKYDAALSVLHKLQAFDAKQTAYQCLNENFSLLFANNTCGSAVNVQHEEEQEKEFDLFDMLIVT